MMYATFIHSIQSSSLRILLEIVFYCYKETIYKHYYMKKNRRPQVCDDLFPSLRPIIYVEHAF